MSFFDDRRPGGEFSASGDVEAWFAQGDKMKAEEKDFSGHDLSKQSIALDPADAPEVRIEPNLEDEVTEEINPDDEATEEIVRGPNNVVPFPVKTTPKVLEPKILSEHEMNEEIAEGDETVAGWFKNTGPKPDGDASEETELEKKRA